MRIIPVVKCKDMEESISFYTRIQGFELKDPSSTLGSPVTDLIKGEAEIQLSTLEGDGEFGCTVNVLTENVD